MERSGSAINLVGARSVKAMHTESKDCKNLIIKGEMNLQANQEMANTRDAIVTMSTQAQ